MERRAFAVSLVLAPFAWSCARAPAKIGVLLPGPTTADMLRWPSLVELAQGINDLG